MSQAVELRESLDDGVAAAASRRNLSFVLAPASDDSRERATMPLDNVMDLDSVPFRDETQPATRSPKTNGMGAVLLTALLLAILGGFALWAGGAGRSWRSWGLASIGSFLPNRSRRAGAGTGSETTPQPLQSAAELRVLQFSAVPDRVAPGEAVRLCYDVANATRVRIDPDIGEVGVLRQDCVSATPVKTTTYMLTAHGSTEERVRRTLLVLVGVAASPESLPEEPGAAPLKSALDAPAGNPPPAPPVPQASVTDRASILIFTARPGSIAAGGPTQLCYAVRGAFRVRIEPDIGAVNPASTLTCLRVAPARTTTYGLTAYGRDGQEVRQQLVIVVE